MNQDPEAAALIAEIDREAEAEKQRILAEARDKAQEILAAADARIQSATDGASQLMEKQARVDEDRIIGEAHLEAAAQRAKGTRRAYERTFEIARERIDALVRSPRYPEALKTLVREALEALPQASRISVARGEVELCRRALRELGKDCEIAGSDLASGSVIVAAADGKVTVDNSLQVRLATAQEAMETRVARCLNG